MKTLVCASMLLAGILTYPAQAAETSIFTQIGDWAPRSSVFDDLNMTAPKGVFETLNDTAPRSDGVFGELETKAP